MAQCDATEKISSNREEEFLEFRSGKPMLYDKSLTDFQKITSEGQWWKKIGTHGMRGVIRVIHINFIWKFYQFTRNSDVSFLTISSMYFMLYLALSIWETFLKSWLKYMRTLDGKLRYQIWPAWRTAWRTDPLTKSWPRPRLHAEILLANIGSQHEASTSQWWVSMKPRPSQEILDRIYTSCCTASV